jgi:hypothetical protein
MAGKLNGVMPAVTPNGNRNEKVSKSLLILGKVSPSWRDVTLQQCSTTSVQAYQHDNYPESASIPNTHGLTDV